MVRFFPVLEILEQMGHEHDLSWHKTSVFVKTAVLPSYGALPPVAVKKNTKHELSCLETCVNSGIDIDMAGQKVRSV
jgi:hypothetical protein